MNGMDLETEWMLYQLDPLRALEYLMIRRNLTIQYETRKLVPALVRASDALEKLLSVVSDKENT